MKLDHPSAIDIVGPERYRRGYPHAEWSYLRREDPIWWCEPPNTEPFWAITKHADLVAISKKPKLFSIAERLFVYVPENPLPPGMPLPDRVHPFRHLLHMNPPDHSAYRAVTNRGFTPAALRELGPKIERITRKQIDLLAQRNECDFVVDFARVVPMAVIGELLGVPERDWEQLHAWTNVVSGGTDAEFNQGEDANAVFERTRDEMFAYFADLIVERADNPRDDIISIVASSSIGDSPMPLFEMLSYFVLLLVAGNETTRNAISGGLLALVEHREQLARLQSGAEEIPGAVEEILRWTSPIIQFTRTATEDTELRGKKIHAGDSLCLFYPSANRDEEVFEAPFEFDVARKPNPHMAFGVGEHFCLGANLARVELATVFRQLCQRLEAIELADVPERLRSSLVGGIKHMPIRYQLRPTESK